MVGGKPGTPHNGAMQPAPTVCLLSGGLDSTVLFWQLLEQGHAVAPLSVHYGQRHRCEIDSAQDVARRAAAKWPEAVVPHRTVELAPLQHVLSGSSQTDRFVPVPHGHYEEESMKATVVPNRNMILLAIAAGYAISLGGSKVAIAAHDGDHAIYPDCREEFQDAMQGALNLCHYEPVTLLRPFIGIDKTEIARRGAAMGAPLGATWTCYEGNRERGHCRQCGACQERAEAFRLAGAVDPTVYAAAA